MTHFQSMMCFLISPEAGLFVYFQQKLNWFYELIQPEKQKKHVTSSMDSAGGNPALSVCDPVFEHLSFVVAGSFSYWSLRKLFFHRYPVIQSLHQHSVSFTSKTMKTKKNLKYHNLGDQISEKTWGAITKEQLKTTLTFVVQEEGKEANKHDRLEVVHGVDRVLKPCRNVQHETMKEERKWGARLDFQICKILLPSCLILLLVMLNPQISQWRF